MDNKCFIDFLNAIKSNAPLCTKEVDGNKIYYIEHQDKFYDEVNNNLLNIQGTKAKGRYLVSVIERIKNTELCAPYIDPISIHSVKMTLSLWLRDKIGININPIAYSVTPPVRSKTSSKLPEMEASIQNSETTEREIEEKVDDIVNEDNGQESKKLSLKQIAWICVYTERIVTRANGDVIAKEYRHNSGDKLYNYYASFFKRSNRIGVEDSEVKNNNKLELFKTVIENLPLNTRQKCIDEMNTFKAAFSKEYQQR